MRGIPDIRYAEGSRHGYAVIEDGEEDVLADVLLGGARAVGVLDPQDEDAAVVAGEGPVEERGPGAADVKVAGGARGKADANGLGHRRVFYAVQKVRRRISARGRLRMTSMIRRQAGGA